MSFSKNRHKITKFVQHCQILLKNNMFYNIVGICRDSGRIPFVRLRNFE